jgi:hypothetical protein
MTEEQMKDSWPELKKKLLEKYPHLTNADLAYEIGQEEELLERLQKKLGQNWGDIKNTLSLMG